MEQLQLPLNIIGQQQYKQQAEQQAVLMKLMQHDHHYMYYHAVQISHTEHIHVYQQLIHQYYPWFHVQFVVHRRTLAQELAVLSIIKNEHIYSQSTLGLLLQKATNFVTSKMPLHGQPMQRCIFFFRDKSVEYYNNVYKYGGLMTTYLKDLNGDPRSPINGRLKGLFFSVNMDNKTGMPHPTSIYGEQRLLLHPDQIFQTPVNLYFADFYCFKYAHYVMLVLTRDGSSADYFCRNHLVRMSLNSDNSFCRFGIESGIVTFYVTSSVWVEICITWDIDINMHLCHGAMFDFVQMKASRTGRRVKKNPKCSVCNI